MNFKKQVEKTLNVFMQKEMRHNYMNKVSRKKWKAEHKPIITSIVRDTQRF